MTIYETMQTMNTLFIFFYFFIKTLPVFMELLGCMMEFVVKRLEKKEEE